ncbi:YtxH domain-containing protein [Fulvivirga sp. 29W222]|uniref:YtxH domain-containing protein n=1 Tax=Fulvivirga marina TaxID=2494733 RepID=A0A937FUN9_9BACT|nr:YtxH domain-containing protein [Fulvivirga marina]MBL6446470.1 YtxH domain-containing protein [Fulvivirga marina]
MITRRKLAIALGLAAGAAVAVVATGRNGKKTRQYISGKYEKLKTNLTAEQYDDSEVFYI